MNRTTLYLLYLTASITFSEIVYAQPKHNSSHYTNRIIVQLSTSSEEKLSRSKRYDIASIIGQKTNLKLHYSHRISYAHIFKLPKAETIHNVLSISNKLMQLDEVSYAEPDRKKFASFTPNDPYYSLQWNLHSGPGSVNIKNSWSQLSHDSPITIAVIDTGITDHSDFNNRIIAGYDFITDPRIANDGDSRDNDPSDPGDANTAGECGDNKPEENLSSWHGTIVTGILIAETDNHVGISGIVGLNPQAVVLPLRVLGKCGGYTSDIIDAARWASGLHVRGIPDNPNPARIINLSLGGPGRCSRYEQDAIDEILANNSIIVASAGNEAADAFEYSPGGCNGVITVSASSRQDTRADYSNYGYAVDISAPGGTFIKENLNDHLFSTYNNGKTTPQIDDAYAYVSGSSFAAPTVTGAIALLLDAAPYLSATQIYGILRANSRPFSDINNSCLNALCGSGILDIDKAVSAVLENRITDEAMPSKKTYDQTVNSAGDKTDHQSDGGGASITFFNILLLSLWLRLIHRKQT